MPPKCWNYKYVSPCPVYNVPGMDVLHARCTPTTSATLAAHRLSIVFVDRWAPSILGHKWKIAPLSMAYSTHSNWKRKNKDKLIILMLMFDSSNLEIYITFYNSFLYSSYKLYRQEMQADIYKCNHKILLMYLFFTVALLVQLLHWFSRSWCSTYSAFSFKDNLKTSLHYWTVHLAHVLSV